MGIIKGLFSKKNENIVTEVKSKEMLNSYEEEPEQAASIVVNSIKNGQYSDICNKLEELPSTGYQRTQYVFPTHQTAGFGWLIAICVCFIAGYLYFAVMGLGMHIYSDDYEAFSMMFLGATAVVMIVNILVIILSVNSIKFVKRYEKYEEIFRYKNVGIIDDINNYTKFGYSRIVKDLSNAVKQRLIPEGHFTSENLVFIASDELYAKYEENKPVYDRYYKKIIEERARIEERSEEIQKILDIGQAYIDKIHDSNIIIKDKDITEKLNKMERIVATIFREVDVNPSQSGKLGMFLNYYLPTTEKLISTYIDISEKKIEGISNSHSEKDIGRGLDMLIDSFEGILNQFYEEQELDVASDISAMEMMIAQEKNGR